MKTKIFRLDPRRPDPRAIEYCGNILKKGGLVAFPTETVYGLGGSLLDRKAVLRIYRLKKRDRAKPLPIQVPSAGTILAMGYTVTPRARRLMDRFWPGPLTVILKSASGRQKAGFRVPANAIALKLIKESGLPVAVPSANISGKPPAKDASGVLKDFGGRIEAVIDGGAADIGIESTVVDMTGPRPKILRRGAISEAEIAAALKKK